MHDWSRTRKSTDSSVLYGMDAQQMPDKRSQQQGSRRRWQLQKDVEQNKLEAQQQQQEGRTNREEAEEGDRDPLLGGNMGLGGRDEEDGEELVPAVEEVRLVVPETDDPSLASVTFRTWTLGIGACLLLSFLNMFFSLRKQQLTVSAYCAQIVALPLGRMMAAALPSRTWLGGRFSLNPGPFNVKEHVLITMFANAGGNSVFAMHVVTVLKAFFRKQIDFHVALIITITIQILGFGFVGIMRKLLVDPSHMWWPSNLVQVSLFRTLHEEEIRPKGGLTRLQFFVVALVSSFLYQLLPGYLFTMLSCISWVCFVWPHSVLAHQLGSGLAGLGLGSVGFDWSTVSGFLGSPLASPFFAIVNVMVGFFVTLYILVPLAYWKANLFGAKTFPLFSKKLFASNGHVYNTTMVLDDNFQLDINKYESYSDLHLSTIFIFTYACGFATITSSITHVALFYGKEIWTAFTRLSTSIKPDIHAKLMRAYKTVPNWWFFAVLLLSLAVSIFACEYYNHVLQLRWWGVLLGVLIGFFSTLPIGIIYATTNQLPSVLYIITESICGYIYPGRPIATLLFRGYGTTTMLQALHLSSDLKLGHYMKIPPRAMFMVQIVGSAIAGVAYLCVGWWLLESIPDICDVEKLPASSPWTCPHDTIYFDGSVIWGLIGPKRVFGKGAIYSKVNWAFLFGALAPVPVWLLRRAFPDVTWLKYVVTPIIIGGAGKMPYGSPVNYWSWFIVGFVFNYWLFRYRKDWWKKHNYVLSGALDAGVAFIGVFVFLTLDLHGRQVRWWGNKLDDQCPLATCPTAPGIKVKGCPVF